MKIAVTNAVLSNTGDAAIFQSILDSLYRVEENIEVVVFDSNADASSKLYPEWNVFQQLSVSPPREPAILRRVLQKIRFGCVRLVTKYPVARKLLDFPLIRMTDFSKSLSAFKSADLMISSGGTYLVDHYNFEARAVELELASSLGIPVVLWTQSMGPFKSEQAITQIRRIAAVTDLVSFRDSKSYDSWVNAVESSAVEMVVPDSVFALETKEAVNVSAKKALISVRQWARGVDQSVFDQSSYESSMAEAASTLLAQNWKVTALSTCQGVESYSYDDSSEALRIFEGLDIEINRDFHKPNELLDELRSASLVVTTRMHLAILAIISRVPVIAIAYEFKTVELFESLGLSDYVCRIEDVTPEWISSATKRLLEETPRIKVNDSMLARLRDEARLPAERSLNLVRI